MNNNFIYVFFIDYGAYERKVRILSLFYIRVELRLINVSYGWIDFNLLGKRIF